MFKEGQMHIPSGCAISGIINRDGKRISGETILHSISVMHDRSNGLGGGFAAYGIYPQYSDLYAFHLFYDSQSVRETAEHYLLENFEVAAQEKIPTHPIPEIRDEPVLWRYFLSPRRHAVEESRMEETEFVIACIVHINEKIPGAFVFSSGKNMGVFKAVGYPEDVGRYYRLDEYEGYCWTAHGRYPTNTPGWWGGAHPFSLLETSVVHNGEISSYDANRRYIEMFGYKCTLQTDTEVIAYTLDFLVRKRGLTWSEASTVIAAPFWSTIENMPEAERAHHCYLRRAYSSLLINGPFSILVGFTGGLMALNDRLKLRSMVVGEKGDTVYIASEESAIRTVCPSLDKVWSPAGGQCVLACLKDTVVR